MFIAELSLELCVLRCMRVRLFVPLRGSRTFRASRRCCRPQTFTEPDGPWTLWPFEGLVRSNQRLGGSFSEPGTVPARSRHGRRRPTSDVRRPRSDGPGRDAWVVRAVEIEVSLGEEAPVEVEKKARESCVVR